MSNCLLEGRHLDDHSSGLRYGLIDVEPFEEKKIVKRYGMKFVERTRGLRPSKSFQDYLRFNTEEVLEHMAIPRHLDRATLSAFIQEERIKRFESDAELQKIIEDAQSKSKRRGARLTTLVEFFLERQKANLDTIFMKYAEASLASDLPLRLFNHFADFHMTYTAALELLLILVRKYEKMMNLQRARQQSATYNRVIREMKFKLSPIIEQIELSSLAAQSSIWYVFFCNVDSLETISEERPLLKSKLNDEEFERLLWESEENSKKLRELVMKQDVRTFKPLIEESDLKASFNEVVMTAIG